MELRPYQNEGRSRVHQEWESNQTTLVQMATGLGKTRLASSLIYDRRNLGRALFLCHRSELVFQAYEHIKAVTGLSVGIEMGGYKTKNDLFGRPQVVIATIQTLHSGGDGGGRFSKFLPDDFATIIADECHRAISPSWKKIINYHLQNKDCKLLGISATCDRADEEALGQVFETVAFDYGIIDGTKDGWLVPVTQQMVSIESLDFSQIKTTLGDLNSGELAIVMEAEKNLHGVASATIEIAGNKRGIGFAASVNQARILSDIFNRHRPGMAAWVCGKTPKNERRKILNDFSNGVIQFVFNCGVLTEGFDDAGVEIIAMARPTKSRALYAQCVGRSLRPHGTIAHSLNDCPAAAVRRSMISRSVKQGALIIDFVGNSGKHKLVTSADILGGNVSDEAIEEVVRRARKTGQPVRVDISLEEEEKRIEERKKREAEEAARKARLVAKAKFSTREIDPFNLLDIRAAQPRGWDRGKAISPKMGQMIRNAGMNPDSMNYTKAKQLCGILIQRWKDSLANFKQVKLLNQFGYDAGKMTKADASKLIDTIKSNGWRRPKAPTVNIPSRRSSVDETISMENPF